MWWTTAAFTLPVGELFGTQSWPGSHSLRLTTSNGASPAAASGAKTEATLTNAEFTIPRAAFRARSFAVESPETLT